MRSQNEIVQQLYSYKEKLAVAIEEKKQHPSSVYQDVDLLILSLIDKIEELLWVLELEISEENTIDCIMQMTH